ncbi:MAG: gliding motility-associated C-terminal domain-containing protein [Bacteroidia bacterium]|nr:gliding motility-associated C-terminal domain-containing protein [Bacteroidia bacterium]
MRIHTTIISFICVIAISLNASSQNESNYWYFGSRAGLRFNTAPPNAITDGQINSYGGSACISDNTGSLLFYSDGVKIWNKIHNVMPNGNGLLGNYYSTQPAIIVPRPSSTTIYYVFTTDSLAGINGLRYTKVDMTLNGGLGDVDGSEKNVQLLAPVTEKLTAVKHANGNDFWVISHQWNSNKFYVYLVSNSGVNVIPVISSAGTTHNGVSSNAQGYMKASPDGTRIALATAKNNTIEIFNFDNTTGAVTSPISITNFADVPYGIEFSPDAAKLYVSTDHKIYQFNLQSSNIPGSVVTIATCDTISLGALQIGLDGKIYAARKLRKFLGVINNPNASGAFCNYVDNIISLNNKICRIGLPNFIQSYFNNPRFNFENTCYGDTTTFYISDTSNVSFVVWHFGDPGSGSQNISNSMNPVHHFTAPGSYSVQLILNYSSYVDTVSEQVIIHPLPVVNLGPLTTNICPGTDTILNPGAGFAQYLWQNGSSSPTYPVNSAGLYSVTVTDQYGCSNSDAILITVLNSPVFSLGNDTSICQGTSLVLSVNYAQADYHWSTGASTSSITVQSEGTYWVTVSNRCGESSDHIIITVIPALTVELGNDINICNGDSAVLDAGHQPNYLWSNGATTETITVWSSGTYSVEVFNGNDQCPHSSDSVTVNLLNLPVVQLPNDTLVCQGTTVQINATGQYITDYYWSTGSSNSSISVNFPGIYFVTVTNVCSSASDSTTVFMSPTPALQITGDTTIFRKESVQLSVNTSPGWTYHWSPGTGLSDSLIANPIATPTVTTTYYVTVTDSLGCTGHASMTITVVERPLPQLTVYNTFTPNNDGVNDTFYIDNIEEYTESDLEIYNRNGNLVYKKKNYQNDWDGKYKGVDVPAGTYFFILVPGSGKATIHGDVTIIR